MNTVQVSNNLPVSTAGKVSNAPTSAALNNTISASQTVSGNDHYSASSANDAVVAKILAVSINKNVDYSMRGDAVDERGNTLSEKFKAASAEDTSIFSIETVTNNVVNFVSKAMTNMAANGFDKDQLSYFRDQALTGVAVGIEQAKIELEGLADDTLFATIDKTQEAIFGGINNLSIEPADYIQQSDESNTNYSRFASVELTTRNDVAVNLDFESLAFAGSNSELGTRSLFTSNASNISFSIQGDISAHQASNLAALVNKADDVANDFYRADIENMYAKASEAGYSDRELMSLARQIQGADNNASALAYEQIQHMNKESAESDNAAPKAVAEYLNKYLDLIETSKSSIKEQKDFNEIINGIVNQMKDVQVPDLLQAINRFHAFNKKFTQ